MKKLLMLLSVAACLATAQTTATYTAPAGQSHCSHVSPYQQWYQNLVEDSTPPYPNSLQPGNFQMPPLANHPLSTPVTNICANYMPGFVSPDGLHSAVLELGTSGGWFRIDNSQQAIEIGTPIWTLPDHYPALGEAVTFTLDAPIVAVCGAECDNTATGTFHLEAQWSFSWASYISGQRYRYNNVVKNWVSTIPVAITMNYQSTLTILD